MIRLLYMIIIIFWILTLKKDEIKILKEEFNVYIVYTYIILDI